MKTEEKIIESRLWPINIQPSKNNRKLKILKIINQIFLFPRHIFFKSDDNISRWNCYYDASCVSSWHKKIPFHLQSPKERPQFSRLDITASIGNLLIKINPILIFAPALNYISVLLLIIIHYVRFPWWQQWVMPFSHEI